MAAWPYLAWLANGAAWILMLDVAWCSGPVRADTIAKLSATRDFPIAPHNCDSTLLDAASGDLEAAISNRWVWEPALRHYSHRNLPIAGGGVPPHVGFCRTRADHDPLPELLKHPVEYVGFPTSMIADRSTSARWCSPLAGCSSSCQRPCPAR